MTQGLGFRGLGPPALREEFSNGFNVNQNQHVATESGAQISGRLEKNIRHAALALNTLMCDAQKVDS